MDDAPDAEVQLDLEALRIVLVLLDVHAVRRHDDGVAADAREERGEPVGVAGIAYEELHGAAPSSLPRHAGGSPRPGDISSRAAARGLECGRRRSGRPPAGGGRRRRETTVVRDPRRGVSRALEAFRLSRRKPAGVCSGYGWAALRRG